MEFGSKKDKQLREQLRTILEAADEILRQDVNPVAVEEVERIKKTVVDLLVEN